MTLGSKKTKHILIGLANIIVIAILLYLYKTNKHSPSITHQVVNNTSIASSEESCIICHKMNKSFSPYHDPKNIGCVSCHLGDASNNNKEQAHKNMVKIPGNLSDANLTCGKCHPRELHNIQHSLMTTNSGIVAIDKYIFGETDSPNLPFHIKDTKNNTAADEHIRQLCANCHLGAEKKTYGAISELSRGGGCNACHLNYSEEAQNSLYEYKIHKIEVPTIHPSTDIHITNTHCYGCHSRSSRISTNYMGLHETLKTEDEIIGNDNYTVATDGRVYSHQQEDIHHSKGMLCIDCHTSHEVMGDGNDYLHEEDAVKLQCSDCHYKDKPNTITHENMDTESQLVFMMRNYKHNTKRILKTEKDNLALINTYVNDNEDAFLISKKDSSIHLIKPQSNQCSNDNAHSNLACSACHTSWAPRCIACHNEYEPKSEGYDLLDKKDKIGSWVEYVDEFLSGPPTLGVRMKNDNNKEVIPAIPGMIMTIDHGSFGKNNKGEEFLRLFSPNAPHTIQKNARDCKSCHSNPIALGYGEGELSYINESKKWTFQPSYELEKKDNIPQDAWISFLADTVTNKVYSTRTNFRPFSLEEQKKVLLVGSCLKCHKQNSQVMLNSLSTGIDKQIERKSEKCRY